MRVMVTGGAGFVGSHICVALAEVGHTPVIVDTFVNAKQDVPERIGRITGQQPAVFDVDIRDGAGLDELFSAARYDVVIHCAAFKAVGESVAKPLDYYDNNVDGTIALLKAMDRHDVRRLVFSSSATVYGDPDSVPVTEASPVGRATNPYGWTKVMMEQVIADLYRSDPRWSMAILRYFNPVGAHPSGLIGEDPMGIPTNLMPFIAQVAAGRLDKLEIFGGDYPTVDGTGVRDFIHVADAAEGHTAVLGALSEPGAWLVYNLGTGRGTSVLEMVAAFETATGVEVPYEIVARRPGDVPETWAAVDRAEVDLGWKATRTVEDMCADMWRWQRSDYAG
ncbi:MAG TPA: UDP-glucose 4-epimerase GalE [Acidimicrobiia bacterium]|nr:UDP-glucose 4-epimerase GalE [Acidimicrobiia bacterium]